MPSFKLKGVKAEEVKTGFEAYDGPEPTRKGFYRAAIKKLTFGRNSGGSMGFYIVAELEAAKGDPKDHAQFDGFPMFIRSIITETKDGSELKEGSQRNLSNFLAALGTGDEPNIILEDGDVEDGVAVKKIGPRNPIGAIINIDMGFSDYNGSPRPESNGVYKYNDADGAGSTTKGKASAKDLADDEEDLLDEAEEAEEAEETDDEIGERQAGLEGMKIAALKAIAKELKIGISGTKEALIERILDAEFAELDIPEEAEEAEDEEEEEEAEEEEAEEEEEEEEEVDEARAEREAELAEFDRIALKKIIKEVSADFTVLKRHSDDDLREAILAAEFEDELPF